MIYCVEDDPGIRDLILYTLNASGLEAMGFEDGEGLFSALKQRLPELILLDIMLPGEDGIAILKKLRRNSATEGLPVILASAKGTEYDKVIGLDLGADDYLAKPFGMMEMVSRVKAVLRRSGARDSARILRLGDVEMNMPNHTVFAGGSRVELTLKEYALLQLFLENPGQVFTRDVLFDRIWGVDFAGESRTVDVHIATLRTKLGKWGGYIQTVRGVGYRMEANL